jgi:hypothetical protein
MKLYRGDSLPQSVLTVNSRDRGRTFADHFCGAGLMAKFGDQGLNSVLIGKDLLEIVLSHVGYDAGQPEQDLADHSPLISFSEDPETAFTFTAPRRDRNDFEECVLDEATHFMWELDIDLPPPSEPGRYRFEYEADPVNCRAIVQGQLRRSLLRDAENGDADGIAEAMMNLSAMSHAEADESSHYAELIDVVTYIQNQNTSGRTSRLVDNTLQRSTRDREWLLYPRDPMPNGHGFSARFSMNRHLLVYRCFRIRR